jgi:hypothetical protein
MFGMIPFPVKLLAIIMIVGGAFGFGYMKGSAYAEAELQRFAADSSKKVADLEKKNAEISGKVVTQFVDRVNTIKEKEYVYRDIAQKSVPAQHDMSTGWVYTHDISATNGDVDATRSADATPTGIKDNEALLTIISNYSICQQNAQQLISLQKWINDNKTAVDEANAKNHKGKK